MNKKDKLRHKFIADNVKVNATVCSYPLRKVTSSSSTLMVSNNSPVHDKSIVITELNLNKPLVNKL